jgi:hypothetical protein
MSTDYYICECCREPSANNYGDSYYCKGYEHYFCSCCLIGEPPEIDDDYEGVDNKQCPICSMEAISLFHEFKLLDIILGTKGTEDRWKKVKDMFGTFENLDNFLYSDGSFTIGEFLKFKKQGLKIKEKSCQ